MNPPPTPPMNRQTLALAGGPATVDRMCRIFYDRVLVDPVLACLFADKAVEHHAARMAAFLRESMGEEGKPYSTARGCACGAAKSFLFQAHERGRNCPLRDHTVHKGLPPAAGVRGGRFTETQRQRWLLHMATAAEKATQDANAPQRSKFLKIFNAWCLFTSGKYGPFAPDRPGGPLFRPPLSALASSAPSAAARRNPNSSFCTVA